MSGVGGYSKGDRIVAVSYGETDASFIGKEGSVTGFDNGYVTVIMDHRDDNMETYFLPSEIKRVEPLATAAVEPETRPMDGDYGIRIREFGDCFEYFHKTSGTVLLTTQFVSLDTLVRIAEDHREGRR